MTTTTENPFKFEFKTKVCLKLVLVYAYTSGDYRYPNNSHLHKILYNSFDYCELYAVALKVLLS